MQKLLEDSRLRAATACTIVLLAIVTAWRLATDRADVLADLRAIDSKVDAIKAGLAPGVGWSRADMQTWVRRTERLNVATGWQGAAVYPRVGQQAGNAGAGNAAGNAGFRDWGIAATDDHQPPATNHQPRGQ